MGTNPRESCGHAQSNTAVLRFYFGEKEKMAGVPARHYGCVARPCCLQPHRNVARLDWRQPKRPRSRDDAEQSKLSRGRGGGFSQPRDGAASAGAGDDRGRAREADPEPDCRSGECPIFERTTAGGLFGIRGSPSAAGVFCFGCRASRYRIGNRWGCVSAVAGVCVAAICLADSTGGVCHAKAAVEGVHR
jgi:hypothetical protein